MSKEKETKELVINKALEAVIVTVSNLVEDLESIGFGTDDPVCGSGAVDVINRHWDNLKLIAN